MYVGVCVCVHTACFCLCLYTYMQHVCVCELPLLLCLRCSTSMCIMHFTIHGVTLLCILDFSKLCFYIHGQPCFCHCTRARSIFSRVHTVFQSAKTVNLYETTRKLKHIQYVMPCLLLLLFTVVVVVVLLRNG